MAGWQSRSPPMPLSSPSGRSESSAGRAVQPPLRPVQLGSTAAVSSFVLLSGTLAQVVQLSTPHVAALQHLHLRDVGRVAAQGGVRGRQ